MGLAPLRSRGGGGWLQKAVGAQAPPHVLGAVTLPVPIG